MSNLMKPMIVNRTQTVVTFLWKTLLCVKVKQLIVKKSHLTLGRLGHLMDFEIALQHSNNYVIKSGQLTCEEG